MRLTQIQHKQAVTIIKIGTLYIVMNYDCSASIRLYHIKVYEEFLQVTPRQSLPAVSGARHARLMTNFTLRGP